MSRRSLVVLAALTLFAAACGREGSIVPDLTAGGTAASPAADGSTPGPGATASPAATAGAAAGGGEGATPAPTAAGSAGGGGGAAAAPTKPASEGGVNPPKDGTYVYDYSGEASDPFNPAAPPERFDGELNVDVSHSGNVYTSEQTNTEQPGRFTTRARWEADRILLLSYKSETAGGDFGCVLDPPLVIAKIPIKPETFPTQTIKGSGNACDGKLDLTVEAKQTVKDANGKDWDTWRVRVQLQVGNEQFTNTSDQRQWLAPELGVEIRSEGTSSGEFRTPGGAQQFGGNAKTVLKRHP